MDFFNRLFSGLVKARLPGGVVGRTYLATAAVCLGLCGVGLWIHVEWLSALAIGGVIVIFWLGSDKASKFAMQYPFLATLEGAQITAYQKAILASKNMPSIDTAFQASAIEAPRTGDANILAASAGMSSSAASELEPVAEDPEETE
ncbi:MULTISPECIES: hypothetical protein [Burkholderia]|nr:MULTISPECIES: hypothetical protein [Burkholderia]MBJ9655904.1 hypothetical protein [Burkholderia multivorans]MBJ9680035.1 hypothetical protein [Burkholderia multivorans]MBU9284144.1 hypothetical protein [Burkholderia multivorans]MBU9402707.1 hypothetical protein [Burkholderia multivorans]MBU9473033.1 hypothetical protein [Burkholderia multivorans]